MPDHDDDSGPGEPDDYPQGRLRPTRPDVVGGCLVGGLAFGWLVHPLSLLVVTTAPLVSWVQPLLLVLVAVLVSVTAHATWRAVHVRRERLPPRDAVNRLVLARACSVVGPLVAGGYLGYALSWIGNEADLADQRLIRSLVAAIASGVLTVAALLLERACRVRKDDPKP